MTPQVAILIDGGYFLKRLPSIRPYDGNDRAKHALHCLNSLVNGHLEKLNKTYCLENYWAMLYRVFYYDAHPFQENARLPISNTNINFGSTRQAEFRQKLFSGIRNKRKFALRLGHVLREGKWQLHPNSLRALLQQERDVADLTDDDFRMDFRQKGVDMRIGMDITSLALKQQVDTIVLVSGDSDFIAVAKLARREGVEFVLDPMWWGVPADLLEHIDGKWSGLRHHKHDAEEDEQLENLD